MLSSAIELTPLEQTAARPEEPAGPNNRDKCASFYQALPVRELVLHRHPEPQVANRSFLVDGGQSVLEVLGLRDILVRSFAVPPV
jgi:hypothetical protein